MSKLRIARAGEAWEGGFLWEEWSHVESIEARGGMVVAGGADHWLLMPGQENWKRRPPLEDIGPMFLVAAEPGGARRYSVAADKMLAIFYKTKKGNQLLRLKRQSGMPGVRCLAWGGVSGPCALYVLNDDLTLFRMRPDLSEFEAIEFADEMCALASDDGGVLAMVSLDGDVPRVYVTRDGASMKYRSILYDGIGPESSVEVAVADAAVALLVDRKYVLLSRGHEAPFERVEALDPPEGEFSITGPVTFQGTSSDAALLCARFQNDAQRILRVDASGEATSVFAMPATEKHAPPEVTSLSWDASRQTLWGASPHTGIFRCTPPGVTGKKMILN